MTTIFHISDLHFGLEDRAALDWVREAIERERPALVAITGDLTMRARHREFRAACEWISALPVPVTVEVGNHDMPYFNLAERLLSPYRRFRSIEATVEREIDLPGLSVVPLKTVTAFQPRFPWVEGWVRPAALQETLAAIDALPAGTKVLVTAHHPLLERSPSGRRLTIGGEKAMAALASRRIAGILTGHVHDPFDLVQQTSEGPLRMIGAGTLSKRLRASPPSYNRIEIGADGIKVTARNREHLSTPPVQADHVPTGKL
jgi:3',5'-cyclic AMP phosphodiesterase CpdA